jgi:DNA-directed RNA polymerase specialized sigma24 family protein
VASSIADILDLSQRATDQPADRESADVRLLIDRARAGDQVALAVSDIGIRSVYRTALAVLGTVRTEDAAQEAFMAAWRSARVPRNAAFRTWLLDNCLAQSLLTGAGRVCFLVDPPRGRVRGPGMNWSTSRRRAPSPERAALASARARRVREEIGRLSATLRDTLLLVTSGEHS